MGREVRVEPRVDRAAPQLASPPSRGTSRRGVGIAATPGTAARSAQSTRPSWPVFAARARRARAAGYTNWDVLIIPPHLRRRLGIWASSRDTMKLRAMRAGRSWLRSGVGTPPYPIASWYWVRPGRTTSRTMCCRPLRPRCSRRSSCCPPGHGSAPANEPVGVRAASPSYAATRCPSR